MTPSRSSILIFVVTLIMPAALLAQAPTGAGQGRGAGPGTPAAADGPVVANKLAADFFALQANGLSTCGILVGPDGVFMVDGGIPAFTDRLVAAIKSVTDKPIRFMVNTHQHPDHTGGNENFAKLGVAIISRDELRTRLAAGTGRGAAPPAALPLLTYRGTITMHMNGEDVRLIAVPAAHTDGDTMVFFPKSDVLMTGDFYRSAGYPNIDRANGGTLNGLLQGLNAILDLAGPNTRIVPGHGEIVTKEAVAAHRDMAMAIRDKIAPMVSRGQTLEQIVAAKPTADFDARVPLAATTSERFIGQLYGELGGK